MTSHPHHHTPDGDGDGDREAGMALVAFVVLLAVVAVACISLLVDGGRVAAARRAADTISFQAARAAAQHLDADAGRSGDVAVGVDAVAAANAVVDDLTARQHLAGAIAALTTTANQVTVTVTVTRQLTIAALFGHPSVTVTGTGATRIATGIVAEETP